MSTNLIQQIILSLLGGLVGTIIGAIVGGFLTYKGSMNAAKKQINYLYDQERKNREYAEKRQKEAIRNSLKIETQENLDLVDEKSQMVLLSTEAWSTYKGDITLFSAVLQEELIKLYAEVKRYNSILKDTNALYLNQTGRNLEMLYTIRQEIKKK